MNTPEPSACNLQSAADLPVHDVLGVGVVILSEGRDTGGAYASYLATCPQGAGAPPHRHDGADEAFFILEGEFELLCGAQVRRAGAGDHVQIPRGVVHAFTGLSATPARLLGICTPAGHEAFFRDAAALAAAGGLTPPAVADLCRRHHIELA